MEKSKEIEVDVHLISREELDQRMFRVLTGTVATWFKVPTARDVLTEPTETLENVISDTRVNSTNFGN